MLGFDNVLITFAISFLLFSASICGNQLLAVLFASSTVLNLSRLQKKKILSLTNSKIEGETALGLGGGLLGELYGLQGRLQGGLQGGL